MRWGMRAPKAARARGDRGGRDRSIGGPRDRAVQPLRRVLAPGTAQHQLEHPPLGQRDNGMCVVAKKRCGSAHAEPLWRDRDVADAGQGFVKPAELAAGGQVDLFGAQVETQPSAEKYKKSVDRGGVYPSSRFNQDALMFTTTGPNQHSSKIHIISNLIAS